LKALTKKFLAKKNMEGRAVNNFSSKIRKIRGEIK